MEISLFAVITQVAGGLGFFLFGMHMMSDGLQKSAGRNMRAFLEKLTANRVFGALVGIVVTAAVQSSSATTVMVVGFVNAGLMNLMQGLSIVLGANIGTTLTAQLIALKVSALALPAVAIGVVLKFFVKRAGARYFGEVILGFGLLFFGLDLMKDAFVPIRQSEEFRQVILQFSGNPVSAVVCGALMTLVLQSSSATIGIAISMATAGLLPFEAGAALVLGGNIGTTITANIAAIGASRAARQTAFGHFIINFFGVAYALVLIKFYIAGVDYFTPGNPYTPAADGSFPAAARHIANVHSMFNLINFAIFLPAIGFIAYVVKKAIRSEDVEGYKTVNLSDSLVGSIPMAVAQMHHEVEKMSGLVCEMLEKSKKGFLEQDVDAMNRVEDIEETVDMMKVEISDFVVKLYRVDVGQYSQEIKGMLELTHELEKIADHADNIRKFATIMIEHDIPTDEKSNEEAVKLFDITLEFTKDVLEAYHKNKNHVNTDAEDTIDSLQGNLKTKVIARVTESDLSADAAFLYVDVFHNLEKVGDYVYNLSRLVNK